MIRGVVLLATLYFLAADLTDLTVTSTQRYLNESVTPRRGRRRDFKVNTTTVPSRRSDWLACHVTCRCRDDDTQLTVGENLAEHGST